ncbi:MAG: chromosomal replication initiator protein DnaA [Anaerolineae bacterium]|nr:chromosomal replication initiator protein DnaA [Anaerolineae bacterium]
MDADQIWQAALGELQLELTRATFNTWIHGARLVAYEDGLFVIGVANAYGRDWLENRLRSIIVRVLTRLAGRTVSVRFVVWEEAQPEPAPLLQPAFPPPLQTAIPDSHGNNSLNPIYTFDSFIVGPGNRLAQAACQAVAEQPNKAFNPLFLYGGVGLGKTHLLHAIGHVCKAAGLRVLYVSAETFTNNLIEAIRNHTTEAFRELYRTVNVLLVDDVHFIAGKESTQEEFFHTFNTLHGSGSQIIISSDRPPRAMALLEERLRSRFEWGLMLDIQPPELETRIAILRRKAAGAALDIPDEILYLIAERIQSNVRELEGGLNRIIAMSTLTAQPLTSDLALTALTEMTACSRPELTLNDVLQTVTDLYQLTENEMTGPSRLRRIARPRQIAMYLMRQETAASLSQIGAFFGGRDHSTVLYAQEKIADWIEKDNDLRREIQSLREQLYREKSAA